VSMFIRIIDKGSKRGRTYPCDEVESDGDVLISFTQSPRETKRIQVPVDDESIAYLMSERGDTIHTFRQTKGKSTVDSKEEDKEVVK